MFFISLNLQEGMSRIKRYIVGIIVLLPLLSFGQSADELVSIEENESLIIRLSILSILLSVALIVFVIIFLNQRKLVQEKDSSIEVEKRFLRSQLNPHFIFNTLTAIQQFVYGNDQRKAAKFLAEFSKFIRTVLDNSRKDFVLLSDEITGLKHYLNLQKMKFGNFDYSFDVIGLSPDVVEIPPNFIQPIVENSIEHGFNGIDYPGEIELVFKEINGLLEIVVIDNGVGYLQGNKVNSSSNSSSSTDLITKRVNLFSEEYGLKMDYTIQSNQREEGDKGTTVFLQLPLREKK